MKSARFPISLMAAGVGLALSGAMTTASAQDGFLFKAPNVTAELRLGHLAPSSKSDFYDEAMTQLDLTRGDFGGLAIAADISIRTSPRADVVLGIANARSEARSVDRDFTEQNGDEIRQVTHLSRTPMTAGVRFYPLPRGESLGTLAWIPAKFTPYIGAGAGIMRYELVQEGDFVDREDLSIFTDRLQSKGTGVTAYGEAGAMYWLHRSIGLTAGARYSWAEARLRDDYETYDNIDLRGIQATAGFALRF